jgi:hypothetical protein
VPSKNQTKKLTSRVPFLPRRNVDADARILSRDEAIAMEQIAMGLATSQSVSLIGEVFRETGRVLMEMFERLPPNPRQGSENGERLA